MNPRSAPAGSPDGGKASYLAGEPFGYTFPLCCREPNVFRCLSQRFERYGSSAPGAITLWMSQSMIICFAAVRRTGRVSVCVCVCVMTSPHRSRYVACALPDMILVCSSPGIPSGSASAEFAKCACG